MESVLIEYKNLGLQPPVFVAGSFTTPAWQAVELDAVARGENDNMDPGSIEAKERLFCKRFDIPEGRWQYKFRLGHGDWWVCDGNKEIGEKLLDRKTRLGSNGLQSPIHRGSRTIFWK